jgi:hypothetical protein
MMLSDAAIRKMTIDFHVGEYRPILTFRVQSPYELAQLRSVFTRLADAADGHREDICKYEWISSLPPIQSVLLERLTNRKAEPSKTLRLLKQGKDRAIVHWSRHEDGWLECAELLDGLKLPGRQYLDISHSKDASVEISFMEIVTGGNS